MPEAILIAGNARRFAEQTWNVDRYLKYSRWMMPARIMTLQSAYQPDGRIEEVLTRAVKQVTSAPLLIGFFGHGSRTGWAIDDARQLGYLDLAKLLMYRRRRITVVIDACEAMALVDSLSTITALEGLRLDAPKRKPFEKVSVIGACTKGATTRDEFTPRLLAAWKAKEPERIPPELRWGVSHDHFYFPRQAPTPELAAFFAERAVT